MIFLLVFVACTSRTPTLTANPSEPTPSEITRKSPPTEVTPAVTATHAPSPTATPLPAGAYPSETPLPPYPGQPAGEITPDEVLPQPSTPTQPPFGEANLTATAGSSATPTVEVVPSPSIPGGTEIPWSDWEGPGILYTKSSALVLSNFDGSQKSVLTSDPGWPSSLSPETGRIATLLEGSLGVIDLRQEPQSILPLNETIESSVISSDGKKIAYSLAYGFGDKDNQQLWTINSDGSENTLVIDDTGQYITDPGPFRLIPIAWSLDNTKIYMVTSTDSEATPTGMYVADLPSGTIEKALTPQVTLWNVSFSPDRTRIAYRTFQWKSVPDTMPEVGPPYTLNVTDLTTGETRILQESETDQYFLPIWSADGNKLAYSVRPGVREADIGLFTLDLTTGRESMLIPGSRSSRLIPWVWHPDGRLVFTEGDLSSGNMFVSAEGDFVRKYYGYGGDPKTLYTINIDGTGKFAIDSEVSIVLGAVD